MYKVILLIVVLATGYGCAISVIKKNEDGTVEFENLLTQGEYELADAEFQLQPDEYKFRRIPKSSNATVEQIYAWIAELLKNFDNYEEMLNDVDNNASLYFIKDGVMVHRPSGKRYRQYTITQLRYKSLPFSSDFIDFFSSRRIELDSHFVKTYNELLEIERQNRIALQEQQERDRQQELAEAEQRLAMQLAEREEREARSRLEREQRLRAGAELERQKEAEIERIDQLAKANGYKGYNGKALTRMLYETQREGGLEDYVNMLVGCHQYYTAHCENTYPLTRVVQIIDNLLLYRFAEYADDEWIDMRFMVAKEDNKLYQEGQSLGQNSFYIFVGLKYYTTVTGIEGSVPLFEVVKLDETL